MCLQFMESFACFVVYHGRNRITRLLPATDARLLWRTILYGRQCVLLNISQEASVAYVSVFY